MITVQLRSLRREYVAILDVDAVQRVLQEQAFDADFMIGRIAVAAGDVPWVLEDRLDWLLQEFCLNAARALLADADYSFSNWEYHNAVSLRDNVEKVGLQSGLKPGQTVQVGKQALLCTLLDGASAILQFLRQVHAARPLANAALLPQWQALLSQNQQAYAARYHNPAA